MRLRILAIYRLLCLFTIAIAACLASAQTIVPTRVSVSSAGKEAENPISNYAAISADGKFAVFVSYINNLVQGDLNLNPDLFRVNLTSGAIEPVCVTAKGIWENGNSWDATISADGRYVVFTSNANNLDPNLSPNTGPNIYIKDMTTGAVELASVATGHKLVHGSSFVGSVSDDGRYVTFESTATDVVPGDTNGASDVFLYDRVNQTTRRLSVSAFGTQGNSGSYHAQISGNGNYVVFQSDASNLVPGDSNSNTDIFLSDTFDSGIQRISVSSSGKQTDYSSFDPSINADGTSIAYVSWATNLDGPSTGTCIYLFNSVSGTTKRISKNRDGSYANGSWLPSISATGRYIVYNSWSNNIIANDSNNDGDVFLYDTQAGTTIICSVSSTGVQGSHRSTTDIGRRQVTSDGRYVVFSGPSNELDPTDKNNSWNVYLRDTVGKVTKRLSVAPSGVEIGGGGSLHPAISGDGRFTVFTSWASNLVPNDSNDATDVFMYDRKLKTTQILSVNSLGQGSNFGQWNGSSEPSISTDGSLVSFTSTSDNIVDGHSYQFSDVFVRNIAGNTIKWISGSKVNPSNGNSGRSRISANNRFVVYTSNATTIVPGVPTGVSQIYQYDLSTGKTIVVSVNGVGQPGNGNSDFATQSADGRFVAFQSYANNLVPNDTNNSCDIFVRDTVANTTIRVSLASDGSQSVADCLRPWMTPDAKKVVFDTIAGNLVPNDTNNCYDVFVRDLVAGTTARVSTTTGGAQVNDWSTTGYVSDDGRYVTFGSWAGGLVPNDLNNSRDLFRKDLLTGVTIRLSVSSSGAEGNSWVPNEDCPYMLTTDDQTVAYSSSATNIVGGDTNQDWDIFVADIKTDIGIGQVSVTPSTIQSGDTTTVKVKLTSPAPVGGLVVNLLSNNAAATLPATITIPSGSDTGTATITGGSPLVSTSVTISATYSGSTKTVNVTVRPWLTSLTLTTSTANGGTGLSGTIQLVSPAPSGGLVVTLASSDTSAATVAATVKVPAGTSQASFSIATVLVTADKPVKISATALAYTLSANLTVKAVGISVAVAPRVFVGGGPNAIGVVTIGTPAGSSGLTVSLASNSASVKVPSNVVIPAGKVKAIFTVTSLAVSKPTPATITASLSAKVSATTSVTANPVGPLSITLFWSPATSGSDVLAAVFLNTAAPAGGLTLTVSSSDTTVAEPDATVTVPAGQTAGWFTIAVPSRTKASTATITVSANSLSISSVLTVNP